MYTMSWFYGASACFCKCKWCDCMGCVIWCVCTVNYAAVNAVIEMIEELVLRG